MENQNVLLGGKPNKRKKAYTKEQINDLPDNVIVGNLMKMASFFKNNLNMDYSDAMKKARPLIDTDEGLNLIRSIKAQKGQQTSVNRIAPIDLNQPVLESPSTPKEIQKEVVPKQPIKIQGIKSKNGKTELLEPYTSNYFLLVDIIPDLEKRLKDQDLDEVSKKVDNDILNLEFHYICQDEDGTHLVEMMQPDGDDKDKQPDLLVLLKVDSMRKIIEVMEYTDASGNIHKVYSKIDGHLHTNHSMKKSLNENLTTWFTGFKTQAHKIKTMKERDEQYIGSFQFYKDGCEDLEKFYVEEQEKNKRLKNRIENLEIENELLEEELGETNEKYDKIIEIMQPILDEMIGETVLYKGEKVVIETKLDVFKYLAHVVKVTDTKNNEK